MTGKISITLCNEQQGLVAVNKLWNLAKEGIGTGRRMVLSLAPEKRSDAQNALLHACLSDIAKQCQWAGRSWSVEEWKRLVTAAWCRANAQGVEIVPAIDGQGFDLIYQRTSTLTKAECSDLCEYVMAFGAEKGVRFTACGDEL